MRPMRLGLFVATIALALAGCGRGEAADAGLLDTTDEQAREQVADALRAVELLEDRTAELEAEVASLRDQRARAAARLDKATRRLWSSLSELRGSVAEARAAGESASSEVAAALSQAGAAARALAVLDNRFEYHLRQHGGG